MLKKKKKKLKLGSKVPFERKKTQQHSLTITWILFLVISILFSNSKVIVNENVNANKMNIDLLWVGFGVVVIEACMCKANK